MKKTRPESYETVMLILEILKRIPKKGKVSAKQLWEQINQDKSIPARDLRTIQRHLDSLIAHFDIERDESNKPYGYRWKDRAEGITVPQLTIQQALLLTLAERQLQFLLPPTLLKSMSGFFEQARKVLGRYQEGSKAKKAREWPEKVRVVSNNQALIPAKIKAGVFDTVTEALYENRWLELDYTNSGGKRSSHDVMPLGLAQQGPSLYLVCRYRNYVNQRIVALHRINAARVKSESFERPPDFDLATYDAEGHFGFGEGKRIRLNFRIAQDAGGHLLETKLSDDQTVELVGAEYNIAATVIDSMLLDRWLRGFGDKVQIIEKTSLDSSIQDKG